MIGSDIILVVLLAIFVIIILNVNIVNAKKIRNSQTEQIKKVEETTKVEKPSGKLDDSNYLHEYFNNDKVELKEVTEEEIKESKKAVGETKNFAPEMKNFEDDFNTKSDIINDIDTSDEFKQQEEDFEIGIEDSEEEEFVNELTKEFKTLSPEMKAFIMANVMKKKSEHGDSEVDSNNDGDENL
jgi:hypothetical protein